MHYHTIRTTNDFPYWMSIDQDEGFEFLTRTSPQAHGNYLDMQDLDQDIYHELGEDFDAHQAQGFSIYSINKIIKDRYKQALLDNWPWLASLCEKDDIPDEVIDSLIKCKLIDDEKILLDRKFVDAVKHIINKYTYMYKASFKEDEFILIERYEEQDPIIDKVLDYVETLEIMEDLTGDNTTGRHICSCKKLIPDYGITECPYEEKFNDN